MAPLARYLVLPVDHRLQLRGSRPASGPPGALPLRRACAPGKSAPGRGAPGEGEAHALGQVGRRGDLQAARCPGAHCDDAGRNLRRNFGSAEDSDRHPPRPGDPHPLPLEGGRPDAPASCSVSLEEREYRAIAGALEQVPGGEYGHPGVEVSRPGFCIIDQLGCGNYRKKIKCVNCTIAPSATGRAIAGFLGQVHRLFEEGCEAPSGLPGTDQRPVREALRGGG